jgi:hypothetical protein
MSGSVLIGSLRCLIVFLLLRGPMLIVKVARKNRDRVSVNF